MEYKAPKGSRWTPADRKIVMNTVKKTGYSEKVFKELADKLGRTVDAVKWQYYGRNYKKKRKARLAAKKKKNGLSTTVNHKQEKPKTVSESYSKAITFKGMTIAATGSGIKTILKEEDSIILKIGKEVVVLLNRELEARNQTAS